MHNGHRVPLPEEMSLLIEMGNINRSLGRVEGKVDTLTVIFHQLERPPAAPAYRHRFIKPVISLLKAGRDFVSAVASLKELALAIAIIFASVAVMEHPEVVASLIASYNAAGHAGSE